MAIFKLPPESGDDSNRKTEASRDKHKPEFIYLDEHSEQYWEGETQGHAEYFESLNQLGKAHYPFTLRLFTFAASLVLGVCAIALLAASIVSFALSGLFLRTNEGLNATCRRYFGVFQKLVVFSLGTLIATFSPPLGLGMIVLFFMIRGEQIESNFISRFVKNQL